MALALTRFCASSVSANTETIAQVTRVTGVLEHLLDVQGDPPAGAEHEAKPSEPSTLSTKARTTGSSAVGRGSTLPNGMSSRRPDVLISNAFRRALPRTLELHSLVRPAAAEPRGAGGRERALRRKIFIDIRPVNPEPAPGQTPVGSLLGRRRKEGRIPRGAAPRWCGRPGDPRRGGRP